MKKILVQSLSYYPKFNAQESKLYTQAPKSLIENISMASYFKAYYPETQQPYLQSVLSWIPTALSLGSLFRIVPVKKTSIVEVSQVKVWNAF